MKESMQNRASGAIRAFALRDAERHDGAPDHEQQQEASDEDPGRAETGDVSP